MSRKKENGCVDFPMSDERRWFYRALIDRVESILKHASSAHAEAEEIYYLLSGFLKSSDEPSLSVLKAELLDLSTQTRACSGQVCSYFFKLRERLRKEDVK